MLLIDSIYINNGGGKVLLDLLINHLVNSKIQVFYLIDERVRDEYSYIDSKSVLFLRASIFKRHKFYKLNKNKFSVVLCFANIPPTVHLNCKVYTYFHNVLFLKDRTRLSFMQFAKREFIRLVNANSNYWIVQSKTVKEALSAKIRVDQKNILVYPIFDDTLQTRRVLAKSKSIDSGIVNFLYVSDGHEHKNHVRLLEAFQKFNKQFPSLLTLTISSQYPHLKQRVEELKKEGVAIRDIGFVSKERLEKEYEIATAIIFPSLEESFGLGLVEGALHSLPICCSNLPYVFEVIEPSLTFNPLSVDSIYIAMCRLQRHDFSQTRLSTKNMIVEMVNTITNIKL